MGKSSGAGLVEQDGGRAWRRAAGCGLELLDWPEVVAIVARLRDRPGEGARERAAADVVATLGVAEDLFGVIASEVWSHRRHAIVSSPLRFLGMLAVEQSGLGAGGRPAPWLWPELSIEEETERVRALPWSLISVAARGWPLDRDAMPGWEAERAARLGRLAGVVAGVAEYFGMTATLTWRSCGLDIMDTVDELAAALQTPEGLGGRRDLWPLALCHWGWVVAAAGGRVAADQGDKAARAVVAVAQFVSEFGEASGSLQFDDGLACSPYLSEQWSMQMPTWMADQRDRSLAVAR